MIKAALLRTADWLEANPSKHIAVRLATDNHKVEVDPFDPTATCFCAYGRMLVELGDEARAVFTNDEGYNQIKDKFGVSFDDVYHVNDEKHGGDPDREGNPAVIPFLRRLAEKLA